MLKEGQIRIPSGCAISGIFAKDGRNISGEVIVNSMATMHERSNGLGGGFAGYGIYPQYKELYAFHIFYNSPKAKEECEKYLNNKFEIANMSKIPVRPTDAIKDAPLIWRYFLTPDHNILNDSLLDEKEYTARAVMEINTKFDGAYVFSSGKNMGVFKAVGFPEDVGFFYRLEEYQGYSWTAHGRYPTNTPGWWGAPIPLLCLNIRWCTTAKFPPTTQTGVLWKCSAINAHCLPIPKL
jgi:glutamate synthase domain-containing protein 1